jgi:hypothetical protein
MPVVLTRLVLTWHLISGARVANSKLDVNCQLAFKREHIDRSEIGKGNDKEVVMVRSWNSVSLWSHGSRQNGSISAH